jgi:hypothetical protein
MARMLKFLGIPLAIVATELLVLSLWPTPDVVNEARSTPAATQGGAANLDSQDCIRCSGATSSFH